MNNTRIIIFTFILFIFSFARGDIHQASSVLEINNRLLELLEDNNSKKTLIILPVQNFLLKRTNPYFNIEDRNLRPLIERVLKKVKLSRETYFEELLLTEYENKPADPFIKDFIHNLQNKKLPLIAITDSSSGGFNKIPFLEVWISNRLLKEGIDISKSPLGEKQIIFNKNFKQTKGSYPTFYRGLLSSNMHGADNMYEHILAFMLIEKLKWMPDTIYIIHTEENTIKLLQQQFKHIDPDVRVIGFHYLPPQNKLMNKALSNISPQKFMQFWEGVITKLNNIKLKHSAKGAKDPYEQ
ncbi:MAG: hypothetical protein COA94_00125 [Rickettsiales bacterium]|nr:MAG: hypothetical protein COA94_00125 [Rickettsiales bacterium]